MSPPKKTKQNIKINKYKITDEWWKHLIISQRDYTKGTVTSQRRAGTMEYDLPAIYYNILQRPCQGVWSGSVWVCVWGEGGGRAHPEGLMSPPRKKVSDGRKLGNIQSQLWFVCFLFVCLFVSCSQVSLGYRTSCFFNMTETKSHIHACMLD